LAANGGSNQQADRLVILLDLTQVLSTKEQAEISAF
jgi:hypothetical protein